MNVLRFSDLCAQGKARGQRVFIRADLNVPQDDAGHITEDTRIRASRAVHPHGAGRRRRGDGHLAPGPPDRRRVQARGLAGAGGRAPGRTAGPRGAAARRLGRRRGRCSPASWCCWRTAASTRARRRTTRRWRSKMAALCDIFVHDAFGTAHRAEASTYGIAQFAKVACAGPLLAAEIDAITKALAHPKRPLVAIVAGSKVSTKLTILQAWRATSTSSSSAAASPTPSCWPPACRSARAWPRPTSLDEAKAVIEAMKARGAEVPIPTDVVTAKDLRGRRAGHHQGRHRRGRRRPDPGHRPGDRGEAGRAAEGGRHHRLERPGRRVRVRRLRARHRNDRPGHRRSPAPSASPAAATRWRPSPSTASRRTWATSPPAAAPSWKCWKARPCRPSRSCRSGRTPDPLLRAALRKR